MRLVSPTDPLVSNEMLIEDALKVLAEIDGPTDTLRALFGEFDGYSKDYSKEDRFAQTEQALRALMDLEEGLDEEELLVEISATSED